MKSRCLQNIFRFMVILIPFFMITTQVQASNIEYKNCGMDFKLNNAPKRVVTLEQTATEILVKLGLADKIVGKGYEVNPAPADIAADYNKVKLIGGKAQAIPFEIVLQQQPDFVYSTLSSLFSAEQSGSRDELKKLGIASYISEFDCNYNQNISDATFDKLFKEIRELAKIFAVEAKGEEVIAEQQANLQKGIDLVTKIEKKPSVMWFYSTYNGVPIVAGPGGLPQEATRVLGFTNIFADAKVKWPEISWETVAEKNPDVLILGDLTRGIPGDRAAEKIEFLKNDPVTKNIDAVKNDRFIIIPGNYMDSSYYSPTMVLLIAEGLLKLKNYQ